jgi:DNA topoisomerase IB
MSSFIEHLVDNLMYNDKKSKGYWSLQEICMEVTDQFGSQAADTARTYIIKDVMRIDNEEEYINKSIKAARKTELTNNIFNKIKSIDIQLDGEN